MVEKVPPSIKEKIPEIRGNESKWTYLFVEVDVFDVDEAVEVVLEVVVVVLVEVGHPPSIVAQSGLIPDPYPESNQNGCSLLKAHHVSCLFQLQLQLGCISVVP